MPWLYFKSTNFGNFLLNCCTPETFQDFLKLVLPFPRFHEWSMCILKISSIEMSNLKTSSSGGKGIKKNTSSTSSTLAWPKSTSTPRPKNTFHTGSIKVWPVLPDTCPLIHIWEKVGLHFTLNNAGILLSISECSKKISLFRTKPARWPGGFRPHVHVLPSWESSLART